MKKYAIILLVLLVVGVGLTYQLLTKGQEIDGSQFDRITSSLRSLQTMDQELVTQINNSRYNAEFNHDVLFDLNYQISESFDASRFEILTDNVDAESELSTALSRFESQFIERQEQLERYVEVNSLISISLAQIMDSTQTLLNGYLGDQAEAVNKAVSATNSEIFQLALGGKRSKPRIENQSKAVADITELQFKVPQNATIPLANFKSAAQTIFNNYIEASAGLERLNTYKTDEQLDSIENAFLSHNEATRSISEQARIALLMYVVCLLGAVLLFGLQLRRDLQSLEERAKEVEIAYEELQESQEQVIQSEKMSSLGQMVAGVAHEINTPLGYVSSNINSLKENFSELRTIFSKLDEILLVVKQPGRESVSITKQLVSTLRAYRKLRGPELMQESEQLINDGDYGLMEMSKLVKTLKDFSRIDRQSTEQVDVHDCIKSSITIASNHIRDNNVEVVENYASLPKISCFPSKLNQLFLNIITNACQAMAAKGGQLLIVTERQQEHVVIRFADQGIGMDKETQQKMFDPFFTSKNVGEGTGLGMSIAYKIIEAHSGKIDVESTIDKGTVISIALPLKAPR